MTQEWIRKMMVVDLDEDITDDDADLLRGDNPFDPRIADSIDDGGVFIPIDKESIDRCRFSDSGYSPSFFEMIAKAFTLPGCNLLYLCDYDWESCGDSYLYAHIEHISDYDARNAHPFEDINWIDTAAKNGEIYLRLYEDKSYETKDLVEQGCDLLFCQLVQFALSHNCYVIRLSKDAPVIPNLMTANDVVVALPTENGIMPGDLVRYKTAKSTRVGRVISTAIGKRGKKATFANVAFTRCNMNVPGLSLEKLDSNYLSTELNRYCEFTAKENMRKQYLFYRCKPGFKYKYEAIDDLGQAHHYTLLQDEKGWFHWVDQDGMAELLATGSEGLEDFRFAIRNMEVLMFCLTQEGWQDLGGNYDHLYKEYIHEV